MQVIYPIHGRGFVPRGTVMTPLEDLLVAAAKDPTRRSAFYRALLASDVLVLGTVDGARLDAHVLETPEGPALATFTSADRILDGGRGGAPYVGMNAQALFGSLHEGSRAVLNPWSAFGEELPPEEIAWLKAGAPASAQEMVLPAGSSIFIGQPAQRPEALLEAMRQLFERLSPVQEAYLAQVFSPGRNPGPHCVIGVRTDGSGLRALVEEMAGLARETLGAHEVVDFVEVKVDGTSEIERYMLRNSTSFCRRRDGDGARGGGKIAGFARRPFGKG